MLSRLRVLESGGSPRSGASTVDEEGRLGLIVGGWHSLSKKEDILQQIEGLTQKLGVGDQLDSDWYATGLRRGYVLCQGKIRTGESMDQARQRLLGVAAAFQKAKIKPHPEGAAPVLWAGLQRPKADRDKSSHLGKLRKLFHKEAPHLISLLDCEYRTGTAYYSRSVAASAVLPAPKDKPVFAGKLPGSWVDIQVIAEMLQMDEDETKALLERVYHE